MDETTIRILFLLSGVLLGWGLGMLRGATASLRAIERRLDLLGAPQAVKPHQGTTADPVVTQPVEPVEVVLVGDERPMKDERGAVKFTTVAAAAVLAIVVYSLISTISTNDKVTDTQRDLASAQATLSQQSVIRDAENRCTSSVLFSTVEALNERTQFTTAQANANVALQKAQLHLLRTPPTATVTEQQSALGKYVKALTRFIRITTAQADAAQQNPFPTEDEYTACLDEARKVKAKGGGTG